MVRVIKVVVLVAFLCGLIAAGITARLASAQPTQSAQSSSPPTVDTPKEIPEEGIPVANKLVIAKCASCHQQDEKGNLTRISFERTTPEGWQQIIKRMVRLNGLSLSAEEAREIVKYLSNHHGLAPEEAKPAMYQAERRMIDEPVPDEDVRFSCMSCHALGRAISWRRTKVEWDLLVNMHSGYYPVVEFTAWRRMPRPDAMPTPSAGATAASGASAGAAASSSASSRSSETGAGIPPRPDAPAAGTTGPPAAPRLPVERAIEYFAKNFPLQTPQWTAWRANLRTPKLEGRWMVMGTHVGRDRVVGEVTITPATNADEWITNTKLQYIKDGATVTRAGRAIVYTGYAWRGRSKPAGRSGNAGDTLRDAEAREVMHVSRDWSEMEGRWFWGTYDELGFDIRLRRVTGETIVLGLDRLALKAPSVQERIKIYGANLPRDLKIEDIDFGPGIKVLRIVEATENVASVEVEVMPGAAPGKRDIAVRRTFAPGAVTVYDKVDYIKVSPGTGIARLGGHRIPKGYQQFEVNAFNRGADNKPQTLDDLDLGPIDAEWSIDEFPATLNDDDKDYVGALSSKGLFTPAVEGPNPKRRFNTNNFGDVWVVATYKPKDAPADAKPLTARSYLVVTVPQYIRWDQPEISNVGSEQSMSEQ